MANDNKNAPTTADGNFHFILGNEMNIPKVRRMRLQAIVSLLIIPSCVKIGGKIEVKITNTAAIKSVKIWRDIR